MFEKLSFTRLAKQFKQRGQVSILFSLLMPIFLLFLGVALDLGWYYINVSRLQNAADAAAVAGAQTLLDSKNFDYKNVTLISKYPGKVSNQYRENDIYELTTIENGKVIAEEYAAKNLSGNENSLINSWTNNKVEFQSPKLYEQDDNLYFVVQLKDTVKHFFLSGWFDDMDAPVTAVAMLSRTATVNTNTTTEPASEVPDAPSTPDLPDTSLFPNMPTLPDNPLVISETVKKELETAKNKNVIVGNWEVQKAYKDGGNMKTTDGKNISSSEVYKENFGGSTVYSERWNHFQDTKNHYVTGKFYRTGTVAVFDDVFDDNNDGIADRYGKTGNTGKTSDVVATTASSNTDGKPYLGTVLDSINIDFKPEVDLKGTDWLKEDWDLALGNVSADKFNYKDAWSTSNGVKYDDIKRLRIHSSINFDTPYKARDDDDRQDENKGNAYDILWVRIESEPMLYQPDLKSDKAKANYKTKVANNGINGLNSVNQIIINANKSNTGPDDRPVVIFYDGPETNDVYDSYKSRTDVLHRQSLPIILNLNVPFNAILYAPNSPVVVIGNNTGNFDGFVVAKEYKRLKTTKDFEDELKADSEK